MELKPNSEKSHNLEKTNQFEMEFFETILLRKEQSCKARFEHEGLSHVATKYLSGSKTTTHYQLVSTEENKTELNEKLFDLHWLTKSQTNFKKSFFISKKRLNFCLPHTVSHVQQLKFRSILILYQSRKREPNGSWVTRVRM